MATKMSGERMEDRHYAGSNQPKSARKIKEQTSRPCRHYFCSLFSYSLFISKKYLTMTESATATENDSGETQDYVSPTLDDYKLHISRVPTTFTEDVVKRILEEQLGDGSVAELVLIFPKEDEEVEKQENAPKGEAPKHRGFGFVTLNSAKLHQQALDLKTIRGSLKPNSSKKSTMYLRPYTEVNKDEVNPDANHCYLWSLNRCPYADDCKFTHSGPGGCRIIEKSSTKKKGKCFAFKKGKCTKGDECSFSHDFEPDKKDQESKDKKEQSKKDTPQSEKDCINWKTKGKCRKGDKCPYQHDEALLQAFLEKKNKKKDKKESKDDDAKDKSRQPLSVRCFGMNYATTEEDIRDFFKDCGKIVEVTFPVFEDSDRSKGYCGVLFQSPKAVAKAVELDGKELFGRWLQIQAGKMYLKKWEQYEKEHSKHERSDEQEEGTSSKRRKQEA